MSGKAGRPIGPVQIKLLEALESRGPMTARTASEITKLRRNTASTALRRAVFKGFASVQEGRVPVYAIRAGWRDRLGTGKHPLLPRKDRPPVERPEPMRTPKASSVFHIGSVHA